MGCPIGNLALEVSDGNPQARELIHRNFENWAGRVGGWLNDAGDALPRDLDRAKLARFVLTVMEGGLMQARAAGHMGPFDDSVAVLRDHFARLKHQAITESKKGKQRL
jgi:TetR/AcrR family transcriptional repressor of nem operon